MEDIILKNMLALVKREYVRFVYLCFPMLDSRCLPNFQLSAGSKLVSRLANMARLGSIGRLTNMFGRRLIQT